MALSLLGIAVVMVLSQVLAWKTTETFEVTSLPAPPDVLPSGRSNFVAVTIPPRTTLGEGSVDQYFMTADGDTFLCSTGNTHVIPGNVYTFGLTGTMDIYDFNNVSSPLFVGTIDVTGGGGSPGPTFYNSRYMWIKNGGTIWPFNWFDAPLSPVELAPLPADDYLITGNLLIRVTETDSIDSWDITNPENAIRIAPSPNPLYIGYGLSTNTLVFDSTNRHAILVAYDGFSNGKVLYYNVATNGQISYDTSRSYSGSGLAAYGGFIWNGMYYFWDTNGPGVYQSFPVSGRGAAGGNFAFEQSYWAIKPIVHRNHVFLGKAVANPSFPALAVVDPSTFTIVASLGGTNKLCKSATMYGDTLIFSVDQTLYAYNMSNPAVPESLSAITAEAIPSGLVAASEEVLLGDRGPYFVVGSAGTTGIINFRVPESTVPGDYINRLDAGEATTNVIYPITITFKKLPTSGTEIISVTRYRHPLATGTDITNLATINGRIVSLGGAWQGSVKGTYRIRVLAKASDNSVSEEANLFVKVLY